MEDVCEHGSMNDFLKELDELSKKDGTGDGGGMFVPVGDTPSSFVRIDEEGGSQMASFYGMEFLLGDTVGGAVITAYKSLTAFPENFAKGNKPIMSTTPVFGAGDLCTDTVSGKTNTYQYFKNTFPRASTTVIAVVLPLHTKVLGDTLAKPRLLLISCRGYSLNPENKQSWYSYTRDTKKKADVGSISAVQTMFRLGSRQTQDGGMQYFYGFEYIAPLNVAKEIPVVLALKKQIHKAHEENQEALKQRPKEEVVVVAEQPSTETAEEATINPDDIPF